MLKKQYLYLISILGLTLTLWIHHTRTTAKQTLVSSQQITTADVTPTRSRSTVNFRLIKVESGDDVLSILRKFGFSERESYDAIEQARLPKKFLLAPGETYWVSKNGVRFFDPKAPLAYHFWRKRLGSREVSGGELQHVKYQTRLVTFHGHVENSLIDSVAHAIGDEHSIDDQLVAYRFMDAFLLDNDFPKSLQRNAAFSLTVEKLYEKGVFVRFGRVRRADLELDGRKVVRVFKPLDHGGIFFARSLDSSHRPFYAPVDHIQISSLFNRHRFHPIKHRIIPHLGVDFETAAGQPVFAAATGFVKRFGRNHAAGQFVVIQHTNGYQSFYDHLSQIANIHPGEHVSAGQVLGYVGCTGYCTRPHLHFAVKRFGQFINPIHLIRGYAFNQRSEILTLLSRR